MHIVRANYEEGGGCAGYNGEHLASVAYGRHYKLVLRSLSHRHLYMFCDGRVSRDSAGIFR